ncbi:hypothetical protein B0H34DRAFT_806238 [Crassisporium funariophilum]|nr:hypothetical protein B0H34DRAFT_806238 [Crassisporium funariophilum]
MKRGAENYLTKDGDEGADSEETPGEGFKKADEAVLAARPMRGLPKRAGARVAQAPTMGAIPPTVPPTSLFGAPSSSTASSFGTSSTPTNGFSTSTTSAPPTTFSSSSAFSAFSQKPSATPPSSSFSFAVPSTSALPTPPQNPFGPPSSTSSSQSAPAKSSSFSQPSSNPSTGPASPSRTSQTLASFLNTSSSSGQPPTVSSSNEVKMDTEDDTKLVKLYTNLRALNQYLVSAILQGAQNDPFADLSDLLTHYKAFRSEIQIKYGDAPSADSSSKPSSKPPKPPGESFTMPPAPTAFAGFGKPSTQGANSSGSSASSNSHFGASSTTNTFSSAPPTPAKDTDSSNKAPKTTFSFGSSSSSGFGASTSNNASSAFAFQFGADKSSSSTSPSAFGGLKSETSSIPFKFGASTDKSTSGDIFGGDKGKSSAGASTFSPSSTTQSVFGSSTDKGASEAASNANASLSMASDKGKTDNAIGDDGSGQTTPTTAGGDGETSGNNSGLLASNPHDEEGVGEENEDTIHAVKLKAYRMRKSDEKGGSGWAELGLGIMRLKKDRNSSSRRILLRNSTNGKILLNFKIYSGLKPSLLKKALTLVGHDEIGTSQTYCIRMPSEDQANQLKTVLDREIAFVKAKETE